MDHRMAFGASLRCWRKLVWAIEKLPDSDRKQYELDKIFSMSWMQKKLDL